MDEYRVLKTILLGYIDPKDDEQHDLLIRPDGATLRFDGHNILFQGRDGQWRASISVNFAIDVWVLDGSLEKIDHS